MNLVLVLCQALVSPLESPIPVHPLEQQTTAHRPNWACCLFIKLYQNTAMLFCVRTLYDCFHAIMTELTESIWPMKPKIFASDPKICANLCSRVQLKCHFLKHPSRIISWRPGQPGSPSRSSHGSHISPF